MLNNMQNGLHSTIAPRLGAVVDDVVTLLHQELSLLRSEIREEVLEAKRAVIMLGFAAGCGIVAIFLIAMGLVLTLAHFFPAVPLWGWYLMGGVFLLGCAYLFMRRGQAVVSEEVNIVPPQTIERFKESLSWKQSDA